MTPLQSYQLLSYKSDDIHSLGNEIKFSIFVLFLRSNPSFGIKYMKDETLGIKVSQKVNEIILN